MPISGHKPSPRAWKALTPALSEWILEAISTMGFDRMTPVQASTIPLFMGHKDVVVEAVTGSGKTLSFLIPVIERLLRLEEPVKRHHIAAIIISPTRELASQIHTVLQSLLTFHIPSSSNLDSPDHANALKIKAQLLLGGNVTPQQDLAHFLTDSPNLIISTPGRLTELLSSPHVHCPQSSFEVLVLDEADRLLDLGFKEDIQNILNRLPKQRRTGLFSASVSEAVDQLVRVGLRNPVRIAVKVRNARGEEETRTPASLQMTYLSTPANHKLPALFHLIRDLSPTPLKSVVYLSTCAAVDYFQHLLFYIQTEDPKIDIVPLHGKHTAAIRNKNFLRFINSTSPALLLTTDLAARGLDIPQVDLTVQLDPPSDPKTFLHRAGRAGRAGRKGLACVFLLPGRETADYPAFLAIRKTPVSELQIPKINIGEDEARRATQLIRAHIFKDRALHDKAQRAFVSWVRSYSKHSASSIFRMSDLPWSELAEAWGLLRMPTMPELKRSDWPGDKTLGLSLDLRTYAYSDRAQEAKRVREVENISIDLTKKARDANRGAWSAKRQDRSDKEERRQKKQVKRVKEREKTLTADEKKKDVELKKMIDELRMRNGVSPSNEVDIHGGVQDTS